MTHNSGQHAVMNLYQISHMEETNLNIG